MTGYVELHVASNYSFLRGASHVEELFVTAKALGVSGVLRPFFRCLDDYARVGAKQGSSGRYGRS